MTPSRNVSRLGEKSTPACLAMSSWRWQLAQITSAPGSAPAPAPAPRPAPAPAAVPAAVPAAAPAPAPRPARGAGDGPVLPAARHLLDQLTQGSGAGVLAAAWGRGGGGAGAGLLPAVTGAAPGPTWASKRAWAGCVAGLEQPRSHRAVLGAVKTWPRMGGSTVAGRPAAVCSSNQPRWIY